MRRLHAPPPFRPGPRRGFTLVEMMISITIMLLVFAMAVPFFRAQARSVEQNAQRLDARTGGRYGANSLDRDVRVAGMDTPAAQPVLVQAGSDAITINGNLVSRDTANWFAVYVNRDADAAITGSLTRRARITLPNSSWSYPDTTYLNDDGAPSEAETVSYWVAADPARPGLSALYRRVNRDSARVVVRGIVTTEGVPVFRYFFVEPSGRLGEVSSGWLPLRHSVPMHGDAADTGRAGFIDSIRVVRVRLKTVAQDAQTGRVDTLVQESSIRIMNAGLLKRTSCGDAPRPARLDERRAAAARLTTDGATGRRKVVFNWLASLDENGGERDVQRYNVYKRLADSTSWGEPITNIGQAGTDDYEYEDFDLSAGTWVYSVSVLDCTPRRSTIVESAPVVIP